MKDLVNVKCIFINKNKDVTHIFEENVPEAAGYEFSLIVRSVGIPGSITLTGKQIIKCKANYTNSVNFEIDTFDWQTIKFPIELEEGVNKLILKITSKDLESIDVLNCSLKPLDENTLAKSFNCTIRLKEPSPILKYFDYDHLPEPLRSISAPLCDLAEEMDQRLISGPEKTAGLRKLLEAKDCFVRASLPPVQLEKESNCD